MSTIRMKILFISLLLLTAVLPIMRASEMELIGLKLKESKDFYKIFEVLKSEKNGPEKLAEIKHLCASGLDINSRGWHTSLHGASAIVSLSRGDKSDESVRSKTLENARLLIKLKADVNQTDSHQTSALMFSVRNNFLPMVELLLENNADPNLRDWVGESALMWASFASSDENCSEVIRLLFESNADSTLQNNKGETALTLAEKRNKPEVLELIRKLWAEQTSKVLKEELSGKEELKCLDKDNTSNLIAEFIYPIL